MSKEQYLNKENFFEKQENELYLIPFILPFEAELA